MVLKMTTKYVNFYVCANLPVDSIEVSTDANVISAYHPLDVMEMFCRQTI